MNYSQLWHQLSPLYGEGEAKAIARMVYEVRFGLSLSDLLLGRDEQLSATDQEELESISQRLMRMEPVQYILGTADFCGRSFHVEPGVLIPRPETEELCQWIVQETKEEEQEKECHSILDMGTGSGCIAITLAAEIAHSNVTAWDISEQALAIAKRNADHLGVSVHFEQVDILRLKDHSFASSESSNYSIIVSNPPYILNNEHAQMSDNVLKYEPHSALFAPDEDPLLFYRAIADFGLTTLKKGGSLFFEINPLCVNELHDLLSMLLYHDIETRYDQYGKPRMIKATR